MHMSTLVNTSKVSLFWNESQKIQHSCNVCGYLFRDQEDFASFKDHEACTDCVDIYYYVNADAWNKGWRPKLEKKDDD